MSKECCRFCLKTFDLRPIFLETSENERYSEILEITTGLKITINDGLPQSLCSECTENINSNLKFRNQCQQSEAELLRIGFEKASENTEIYLEVNVEKGEYSKGEFVEKSEYLKNEFLEKDEYSKGEFVEINEYSKGEFVEKDEYLRGEYLSKDKSIEKDWKTIEIPALEINIDLQRLTQDHFVEDNTCLSSEGKEVKSELKEAKEVSSEPKEAKVQSKKEKREELLSLVEGNFEKNAPVKCKVCKKILKSWPSFVSHAKLHLGFKFVCEFCGKSFISSTQLNRHCRSHHGMEKSLRCNLCDFMALDNRQLSLHVRREHTGVRPYTCDSCGNSYFNRRCLIQHLETHRDRQWVQCNTCGGVFKSSRHLSKHTYVVHTRKLYKYKCTICTRVYASPKYARLHINRYHGRPSTKGDIEKIHV